MTIHQEFLKFEAVLAHREARVPTGTLFAAIEYGPEMHFSIALTPCHNKVSF